MADWQEERGTNENDKPHFLWLEELKKHTTPETRVGYLFDSNGMFHRGYWTHKELKTSDGRATGAIFYFVKMLKEFIEVVRPRYLATVWDRRDRDAYPGPVFRKALWENYKANRKPIDDAQREQLAVGYVDAFIEGAFNVRNFNNGYRVAEYPDHVVEADDVLATLAHRLLEEDEVDIVVLVTKDKDLFQLVDDTTWVLTPNVGITDMTLVRAPQVTSAFGVPPAQVLDYKALVGDTSDGIPGVPGLGDGTYRNKILPATGGDGSLEAVYSNLDKLKGKLPGKILDAADNVLLFMQLVQLRTDVQLWDVDISMDPDGVDWEAFYLLCDELEFTSLIRGFQDPDEQPL